MAKKSKGPAAYPLIGRREDETIYVQRGMTMRDVFAKEAMPVLLDRLIESGDVRLIEHPDCYRKIAACSYAIAAAMMEAREAYHV
jgi:hypothetical protein